MIVQGTCMSMIHFPLTTVRASAHVHRTSLCYSHLLMSCCSQLLRVPPAHALFSGFLQLRGRYSTYGFRSLVLRYIGARFVALAYVSPGLRFLVLLVCVTPALRGSFRYYMVWLSSLGLMFLCSLRLAYQLRRITCRCGTCGAFSWWRLMRLLHCDEGIDGRAFCALSNFGC